MMHSPFYPSGEHTGSIRGGELKKYFCVQTAIGGIQMILTKNEEKK